MNLVKNNMFTKLINVFFVFVISFSVYFVNPGFIKINKVNAGCDDNELTVTVVFRDADGNFVPNLNYAIYEQDYDADDNPKPKRSIASGKTDQFTGIGTKTFCMDWSVYLVKAWDENDDVAPHYFYDAIGSGTIESHYDEDDEETYFTQDSEYDVSSIHFVLRDSQGELLPNTDFDLYTQKSDADGNPIVDEKVSSYDTGLAGEVTTYVVDKRYSVDGLFPGYYAIEISGSYGSKFMKYGVYVKDGEETEITYKLSDIAFTVVDKENVPFPSGSSVKVYNQIEDLDGEPAFGSKIATLETDDKGVAVFQYPHGTYAAQVVGGDGQIFKYFDLNILEQKRSDITLKSDDTFISEGESCSEKSFLNVVPRSASNQIIPGLQVELYKQEKDANGKSILTNKITSEKVDSDGQAELDFNPDPRSEYGLKIYDGNKELGDFIFYDALKFACDEDKDVSKTLSSIKFIIRDPNNEVLRNQDFTVYVHKTDVDGNPIQQNDYKIKNLKTSGEGYAVIYVADDHQYDPNKKGVYSFSVRYNKVTHEAYNIQVDEGKETVFEFVIPDVDPEDVDDDDDDSYTPPNPGGTLLNRLKGYILLQVEERGEAWYVDHDSQKRYYMKDGPVAYEMMRKFGLGIATADLEKIPIGIDDRFEDVDTDGDGLADKMEEALGSDIYDTDSDDDGFLDGAEVRAGYSPVSTNTSKISTDRNLTDRLLGKILLQVESRGEAWYLNPQDGKRYYMKDGPAAYQIMRFLSLGITNQDLNQIGQGSL